MAILHVFLIVNLMNGSAHPTSAVIRITYTREAVRSAAQHTGDFLLQAIDDLNRLRQAGGIPTMNQRDKALRSFFEAEVNKNESALDPSLLCRAVAHKAAEAAPPPA